ncbi:MAG: hypothetical protein JWL83_4303 [Actinomycetia bacterium]|nr:hypothetical protein [Actinomycetes bacterium]
MTDLAAQIKADGGFLVDLEAIRFSARADVWARNLRTAVREYVNALADLQRRPRPLDTTRVPALDEQRAEASANLRAVLGLRQSTCDVLRP